MASTIRGNTDYQTALLQAQRQQKLAEALRQQSFQPIESSDSGALKAPISWTQGLSKMLQGYAANKVDQNATQNMADASTSKNKALADTLKGAFSPVPGNPQQYGPFQDGSIPGREKTPQEISQALLANPDTMELGGQMMVADVKGQADMNRALQTESLKQQMKSTVPSEMPADIRSFREFQKMSPSEQQSFLNKQRQMYQISDIGNVPSLVARMPGVAPTPISTIDNEASGKAAVAGAEAKAKANVGLATDAEKKSIQADSMAGFIKQADSLLNDASGSYPGAGLSAVKGAVGISDKTTQANHQLKLISGWMVSNVPRMEGPQSNYDVGVYREMAGKVGDTTVPVEDRRAALKQLKFLQSKYLKANSSNSAVDGQPELKTINGKTYIKQNGQWFEQ